MSTYVIAEGGACHDGDFEKQLRLIVAASNAGCNAYKTQWTSDPVLMARRRGRAIDDGYADIYRRYLCWPAAWHERLATQCRNTSIDYMATVFIPADIAVIAPHVARFKVASFEAADRGFLQAHRPYRKRLIVSTGMLSLRQVESLHRLMFGGWRADILHCVSAYPAPADALGLSLIRECRDEDNDAIFDGFSDHSDPVLTWTGALAVAAGASVVEAHLRLDGTDPANPDYPHAMTPAQFAEYVANIRFTEQCLGSGEKRLQDCEREMVRYQVGVKQAPSGHLGAVGGE